MIYAIVAVLVLIADQAVKFWTTKNILLDAVGTDCVELIKGVIHMTNIHNYGAAFSILQNARWLLVGVTVVFVVGVIVLISQEIIHTRFGKWTAVLMLAGAIGNCIDRVMYGYVVDMFEFEFFNFAVFNIADVFITVSGILFLIHVIFHNEPEEVKKANEPDFLRRRREEKEAKEAPYAGIPRRGEHKSLDEVIGAADSEDPFAEWDFGAIVEKAPAKKTEPKLHAESFVSEEPAPEPAKKAAPKAPKPAAEELPVMEEDPETPAVPKDGADEFSLEDILSEFGDL